MLSSLNMLVLKKVDRINSSPWKSYPQGPQNSHVDPVVLEYGRMVSSCFRLLQLSSSTANIVGVGP